MERFVSKLVEITLKVRPEFVAEALCIVESIPPTKQTPTAGERILRLAIAQLNHMERSKGYMQTLRDKRKKARGAI